MNRYFSYDDEARYWQIYGENRKGEFLMFTLPRWVPERIVRLTRSFMNLWQVLAPGEKR